MFSKIKNKADIIKLFPQNTNEIAKLVEQFINETQEKIDTIIAIDSKDRTFENTAASLDKISSLGNLSTIFNCLTTLEMLSPKKEIREVAHKEILKIQNFWVEKISNNKSLYKAFKDYSHKNETLSDEQKYFIEETLQDYKRAGLDLPQEKLEEVKKLNIQLGELCLKFETNIAKDQSSISATKEELKGIDKEFLDTLEKESNEKYEKNKKNEKFVLGTDYPTYFEIMDNCCVEETRKKLYLAFNNRAHPENEEILKEIITKRNQLAKILGFESYAHLDLDGQMANNPEIAKDFLNKLYKKANLKQQAEFEKLSCNLPKSAKLTNENKIKAWDSKYIKNYYKKKNFNLDEQEVAKYFPTENTVKQLLKIYETFLSLKFEISDIKNLWDKDIKLIETYSSTNNELLGYLLLDLYPRENKYNHACQITIVPAVKNNGPSLCLVVANFPKSTENKPSLLKLQDVETFFHELGHALHAILGRTSIASFSGTNVKTDFVEMPSQMLEEWLSDKEILRKISCHYKTNNSLPSEIINKILELKHFDTGDFLQRQCYLSCLALEYFSDKKDKDPKKLYQELTKKMRPNIEYDEKDNMYSSFGHLSGYGAKYYSYMWSKVYAIDMFYKIKDHGLLDPKIGKKYVDQVISKGGSQDPNNLLKTFLNRAPNQNAFLDKLGIKL